MAHIVYYSIGMSSTLRSSIELGHRLLAAGHRVTFISHRDIADQIISSGFPFHRLVADCIYTEQAWRDPMPPLSLLALPALLRWIGRRRRLRAEALASTEVDDLVARLVPDLLLIDIECHYGVIATARLDVPTFLVMLFFSVYRQAGLPPLHSDLFPGAGIQRRLTIDAAWWRLRVATWAWSLARSYGREGLRKSLRPVAYGTMRRTDLCAVARERGYDLHRHATSGHWLRPFMYRDAPILCLNLREMELPQRRRPNVHYVGPMLNRCAPAVDTTMLRAWQDFRRARSERAGRPRPLIYCSLGSFWSTDRDLLARVIAVFERRGDWDLVLGLGGKLSASSLAGVPSNVLPLEWAPQMEVLQIADCAITHGGITSINECIRCRVPMVAYSTKHVEQNGNAVRVAFHRLGIMADKDRDTSGRIEHNIDRCLSDPYIQNSVARMQQILLAYEEANEVVRLVEASVASES